MPPVTPTLVTLPIDAIRPYWRNPRKTPEASIVKLAKMIEDYGYQQPIVVDTEHVVIVGHTRLAAIRRLGWTDVPVIIAEGLPPEKVREYRVMDNKAHELTGWDQDKLLMELREFSNPPVLETFFADLDLSTPFASGFKPVTNADVEQAVAKVSPAPAPAGTAPAAPPLPNPGAAPSAPPNNSNGGAPVSNGESARPDGPVTTPEPAAPAGTLSVTCPHCYESFELNPGNR
jgi:hypothetical protein